MAIRRVTDELSVADQISVDEIRQIARDGYRSIICNRPDGEAPDQPDYADIEAAARDAGLEMRWQPVVSGQVSPEDGATFGRLAAELPKPVLAYCRSGTRCITLWSLSQAPHQPIPDILATAQRAGYDLSPLAPVLSRVTENDKA